VAKTSNRFTAFEIGVIARAKLPVADATAVRGRSPSSANASIRAVGAVVPVSITDAWFVKDGRLARAGASGARKRSTRPALPSAT